MHEKMDIDLEDVDSYPKAVYMFYLEQKRKEERLKDKEKKMV